MIHPDDPNLESPTNSVLERFRTRQAVPVLGPLDLVEELDQLFAGLRVLDEE